MSIASVFDRGLAGIAFIGFEDECTPAVRAVVIAVCHQNGIQTDVQLLNWLGDTDDQLRYHGAASREEIETASMCLVALGGMLVADQMKRMGIAA